MTMQSSELALALAKERGISYVKAKEVVDLIFGSMKDALVAGDKIEIRHMFSMRTRWYKPYQGRNPKTGEPIHVKEKLNIVFKVGKYGEVIKGG